jgi:hypothetical protein
MMIVVIWAGYLSAGSAASSSGDVLFDMSGRLDSPAVFTYNVIAGSINHELWFFNEAVATG